MYWGIDLGGTKVEGIVLDSLQSTALRCRKRITTQAHLGYEHILRQVSGLVSEMSQEVGEAPSIIGLGHPGAEDPQSAAIKNSNTVCLIGHRLRNDLEQTLKCCLVCANDANCFALAESYFGAGKGVGSVFGVIMGTGVGGGIVIDGKVLLGAQRIAGEWGHNELVADGPPCYCGRRGCVETIISGPALESFYAKQCGRNIPLTEIAARSRSGTDPAASAVISRLTSFFGKAIAGVINILDPDCIVLGGGLSNIDELYTAGREEARKHVFNMCLETSIVPNQLGDSAGVFGAALLAAQMQR